MRLMVSAGYVAMFGAVMPAHAEQSEATGPMIEVTGRIAGVAHKIDRRTYQVKTDPRSQAADGYDLLRGVPAVVVQSDDTMLLLGSGNVKVMIDGKAIYGDAGVVRAQLRNLHGVDVERIEVITNPSAEFAPDGAAGIINIVLRKNRRQGFSATVTAAPDSFGGAEFNASAKYTHGAVTVEMKASANLYKGHVSFVKTQSTEQFAGGPVTTFTQNHFDTNTTPNEDVELKLTWQAADHTKLWAVATQDQFSWHEYDNDGYAADTANFSPFAQSTFNDRHGHFVHGGAGLDHDGARAGEKFSLSADIWHYQVENPVNTVDTFAAGPAYAYTTYEGQRGNYVDIKATYDRPLGKTGLLSAGGEYTLEQRTQDYDLQNLDALAALGPGYADVMQGSRGVLRLFASVQFDLGTLQIKPGLQVEHAHLATHPTGQAGVTNSADTVYPSLHLAKPLNKQLEFDLAYSRRIDRPGIGQYNPAVVLTDALNGQTGNPALGNQTTDAYEGTLAWRRKQASVSLIVYDRETANLISTQYLVTQAGASITQPVNSGHKSDRGGELDVNLPLSEQTRVTSSLNLFDSRVPVDGLAGAGTFEQVRYTVNVTAEWSARAAKGQTADSASVTMQYASASQDYQVRNSPTLVPGLSWQHPLGHAWASVLQIDRAFGTYHENHSLDAPLAQNVSSYRRIGPKVTAKLVWNFGQPSTGPSH